MNNTFRRVALPIGAAVILGSSGFAFMASNSVPRTFAGDGSGAITGYNVSDVDYDTDNGRIIALSFTLDRPADPDDVEARITNGRYDRCSRAGGTDADPRFFCDQNPSFVTATLADATSLRVLAAQ